MIEKILLDYLPDLVGVPVYLEIPERPDPEYVVIQKTGRGFVNRITTSSFNFWAIATSKYRAAVISNSVVEAMLDAPARPDIHKSTLEGEYDDTDVANKRYQYRSEFVIVHE